MRTRTFTGVRLAAVAAVAALGLAACGSSSSGTSGTGSSGGSGGAAVKVGFMGALTGPNAQLGINIKNGAKLAIDEYNATNPKNKIDLVDYDTQGDPAQAASLAPKLITDKIQALVGPAFSGESKTAVPIIDKAGIPNVSASATNATLSQNGWKTWHRVLANDDVQGPGAADFIAKTLGKKNVAVIDDQSEYGKGLSDVVEKTLKADGANVVVRDVVDPKADDYSATVNKVKGANPEAVFYGGYYAEAAKFVKQLRDAGVQSTFVSADGTLDQKFIDGAPQAAEGAFLTCTCVLATASSDPDVQKFIDDYKKAYNSDPATYSAEGYDAATAIIKAVSAGKTTAADILSFLGTEDFKGVSKQIKWNPDGELASGSVYIHEVKGGKIVALGDYKSAKPQ